MKALCLFLTRCINDHAHGKTGAQNALMQRTKIPRQSVRQHRHNAIWEIGRIAALFCLAIKRTARAHIMRDIGNRDPDDMTAFVLRVRVCMRIAGIIMVARV